MTIVVYTLNNLSHIEVEKMVRTDMTPKDNRFDITFKETRFYRDVKAEVDKDLKAERVKEAYSWLVFLQLGHKLGKLPAKTKKTIAALDLEKLELLTIELPDFNTMSDLETWLKQN